MSLLLASSAHIQKVTLYFAEAAKLPHGQSIAITRDAWTAQQEQAAHGGKKPSHYL
jgi:hypothetical protein